MASRCSWFLVLAHWIRVSVSSRSACVSTGEATSMTSSQASKRRILGGAVGTGPSRIASSAREDSSIVATSRTKTSSIRSTSPSEYPSEPTRKRSVRWRSMADRRSSVLCAIELSSCWMSSRGAPIGPGKPFWLATDLESYGLVTVHLDCTRGGIRNS